MRLEDFVRSLDNDLRKLPPSREALRKQAKRSCLQTGYLSIEAVEDIPLLDASLGSWNFNEKGVFVPDVQKKNYMFWKSIFWRNVIEILQNFEKVLWNQILVNIPNFKSIDAKLKKLCWDQLRKVDNYTHEKWKFWRQKMISNFIFRSSFIWL